MRAGCAVFLVSPRNAPAAVADMLKRTGAGHLLVSADEGMRLLAKGSLSAAAAAGFHATQMAMPTYETLFADNVEQGSTFDAQVELPTSFDMKSDAIIMHSSGRSPYSHLRKSCV